MKQLESAASETSSPSPKTNKSEKADPVVVTVLNVWPHFLELIANG